MIPELGQFALILGLILAIVQSTLPLIGAHTGRAPLMAVARSAAYGQFTFIAISFGALTTAFVVQDFSVAYVAQNSNSLLPVAYRFSAVWGAHEGSLLLWVLILAGWTVAVAAFSRSLPEPVVARVLAIMGIVSVGFLLFTLLTSNPFLRHIPALAEGRDLNPLLQDPGLIIHPPMLYAGYVGFAVAFAFAIAALLGGEMDNRWVRWSRPWTNVAWGFLTLGIALGSWWAYYELGWGGWWFWDPVENASFMPWLVGTALIHSQAVTEKRGSFRGWTLLLAIAAFSLSLLGTFLVRSGVLTSVHAFASDPERGLFILAFLGVVVGGSLMLYAWRAPKVAAGKPFAAVSRESLILFNNLLFSAAAAMVLIGTLYPLLHDALGWGKISVGPPYFSALFIALMLPVVVLMPFGPLARWQREEISRFTPLLRLGLSAVVVALLLSLWWVDPVNAKSLAALTGAAWLLVGTALYIRQRLGYRGKGRRFPAEMVGMLLAHAGMGVFVLGVMFTEGTSVEKDVALARGQSIEIQGYTFRFDGVQPREGPNFKADRGTVTVLRNDKVIAELHPEKRAYASGGQIMTEAAIDPGLSRDLYVALGEPLGQNEAGQDSWALRVYVKPWIRCIWLGALMMMLGGFVAAADRRFRRVDQVDLGEVGAMQPAGARA
ncbi:heme lyase CcmF/NrfE family subunit [Pseudomarimonas salicorniae]|uniref:Heme lyase CcmF/NrfE family subunit n=1 Tax=Pseudomarimonas salicorniae TaxID=2933270 RepID=A0ABT0GKX9_9GAMM|nr:heme lyase CcmF/NrfE family subunit [Lysobacter sp. CAU 1642]MCK7595196.1 heme lyase CcmF/NrfE family subunit [Lysobacter sp. CAU 1642]